MMQQRRHFFIEAALVHAWIFVITVVAKDDYSRGLKNVPQGPDSDSDEDGAAVKAFVDKEMEPRHAVAIAIAGEGSKKHRLLEELISNDNQLYHMSSFGIQFARESGSSSLTVYRYLADKVTYSGKWTRNALKAWLVDVAYPPINKIAYQIAPAKYLHVNPYGVVLVVKPIGAQTEWISDALKKYVVKYKDLLKFTFFTKTPSTQDLCKKYGIWTNDEIVLLTKPTDISTLGKHSNAPPSSPKYRLENITEERIEDFFQGYEKGTWPQHYLTMEPRPANLVVNKGIRELTGWDFDQVANDANSAVLVVFVSSSCEACTSFEAAYEDVARRVERIRGKGNSYFDRLTIARIDQSANEHSLYVRGTPWLKYWASGKKKKPVDVELRSADSLWDFLEGQATEEAEEAEEMRRKSVGGKGGSKSNSNGKAPEPELAKNRAEDSSSPSNPRIELGKPAPGSAGRLSLAEENDGAPPRPGARTAYLSTEVDPGEL
jgi:hypothetical protein